jgi:DnaJ-class molecular chaperone
MTSSTSRVDLESSVAGEEDPGASNEIGSARERPMAPGDEARPGTPGTGEKVCPDCGGSGQRAGGTCPTCGGTGKVTGAIGGA